MSEKVMKVLADRIVNKLQQGVVPWRQPWADQGKPGVNPITWTHYRGYNWFATLMAGFSNRYWLTFNQIKNLGGYINKGASPTYIYFFKMLEKKDENDEVISKIPILRYYKIWNLKQVTLPESAFPKTIMHDGEEQATKLDEAERIQRCDEIYESWEDKPTVVHNDQRAYYSPHTDIINMPEWETFVSPEEYYSTLFHEMIHATGHANRLSRPSMTRLSQFGTQKYAKEELVAEMGAARLCYHGNIDTATIDNSAAYIQGWLETIKKDPSIIYQAAQEAEKAYNHIIGATN